MKKYLFLVLFLFAFSFVLAESYGGSVSTNFVVKDNSSYNLANVSTPVNSGLGLIWIFVGIITLLIIIYILFRKPKKLSKRKKF